jgi:hypothetical protein
MIRKTIFFVILFVITAGLCNSQAFIKTADLFKRSDVPGRLDIIQNQGIDTLVSRYILSNKKYRTSEGPGMPGYRIQIYYSSVRNAREESAKAIANFINEFPDIKPYTQYQEPGYFMVRVGDYRTKIEGYKDLIMIRKVFPNAYPVPATITFPDLRKK